MSGKMDLSRIQEKAFSGVCQICFVINMKFQPGAVSSEADLYKLGAMIRTYFDHGGKHIQFNIVDEKVLQDARIHPKDHRDLMVRVAGYSAYYVELTARLQDEILARTKNTSVK